MRTARASCCRTNFYPRPPRGGRQRLPLSAEPLINFYPRPPRGGRRVGVPQHVGMQGISIHALREEGDLAIRAFGGYDDISIHALREEGDVICPSLQPASRNFYPRPPRGGRPALDHALAGAIQFLSTPSARRATWNLSRTKNVRTYFYPRPPRGGRPTSRFSVIPLLPISIHALREEGDEIYAQGNAQDEISIHALREEGDDDVVELVQKHEGEFLSTPSARRATCFPGLVGHLHVLFLSTPSARRATRTIPVFSPGV